MIWPMIFMVLWASTVWGSAPDPAVTVRSALEAGRSTARMGTDRSANSKELQISTVSKIGHDGIIRDGGFEDGTPSAAWTESSSVFGSPLSLAVEGTAGGSGPHRGNWLAWFGGNGIGTNDAALSQTVTLPKGAGPLTLFTQAPVCGSASDVLKAQMDGTLVFQMTGTDPTCGSQGYTRRTVSIATWADDGSHTLTFTSHVTGVPADDLLSFVSSNFLVDDVSIQAGTSIAELPTLSTADLIGLCMLISGTALIALRRRRA